MKVAKFGGSSLSNGSQIHQVSTIIERDQDIEIVVVSAPGKRYEEDTKVTDMLIALFTTKMTGMDTEEAVENIIQRYRDIIEELELNHGLIDIFKSQLHHYLENIEDKDRLLDALKSCGEDFNAQLISQYLNKRGIPSEYMSPKEAGITVTDTPSDAQLLPSSYDEIAKLKHKDKVIVIPGFFGYTAEGEVVTFSRGGSDIIGAIVARGVDAEQYDNFTDQSYIYSAHPNIVASPHSIQQLTYREMRELSYSGFNIFHEEALRPLYEARIPIMIRNTNYPEIGGTKIVAERSDTEEFPVIGVSGSDGFLSITMKRYLLNREVGFARRFLQVFENYGISIEHFPTGIDDVSVIMVKDQFEGNNKLDAILEDIENEFDPEWIHVEENLAVIAIVGEGMRDTIGVANTATQSFTDAGISLNMINQGASEISMFFAIGSERLDVALQYLYGGFFDRKK